MTKILTIGDLLKSEADSQSREAIPSNTGVKIGQLILHPKRKKYLVALSDEENGKVLVQPHNCVIFLDNVAETAITEKMTGDGGDTPLTVEAFIQEGDVYGIKYIGTPYRT